MLNSFRWDNSFSVWIKNKIYYKGYKNAFFKKNKTCNSDFLPPAPFTVYENEVVNKDNTIECNFKLETRNDGKKGDRKFYIHKSKNGEILLGTNPRDFNVDFLFPRLTLF